MTKHIIGLGCSWAQGEGGYPEEIWKQHNGPVQLRGVPDEHLRPYEHANSWVNQLCQRHFPDHTPVNLGVRGIGNRAAVKQLYFADVDWAHSTGYIVLLLSGMERFDFIHKDPVFPSDYNSYGYNHYKWRTMWPFDSDQPQNKRLWGAYARDLHSDQFVCTESLLAMLELQSFCSSVGYEMVVANAYNIDPPQQQMQQHTGTLWQQFDWSRYLHSSTQHTAMAQLLIAMDGLLTWETWNQHHEVYLKLDWPADYLTNCIHPTIKGYTVIADEMARFMKP